MSGIRFHIYLSLFDLLHLVPQSLGPAMLLQMTLFHSLMAEKYSSVYTYHVFFIHSSVNGHLGCRRVLAAVNTIAVNTGVHVSF